MNIVIIEDERLFADDLAETILSILDLPSNIAKVHSVKEAIAYFQKNIEPDLIFSDIQLGDGLSFEVFSAIHIHAPVVFCTAYDEYAIRAFKVNGIDYILKPFTNDMVANALAKYQQFKELFRNSTPFSYDTIAQLLVSKELHTKGSTTSILAYFQDKILPIKLEDIALIYLENETAHILTFDGNIYFPNKNLDELEKATGSHFFRANRQVLVCRKAIADISSFFSRKVSLNLTIKFGDTITVSKARTPALLEWLTKLT
ncbi:MULTISPECIES: LytR/AlgR family response regulator transcription factor [Chitinophagaceae]